MVFQRAYSHCPMTLPSHLSIMTGLLPTEHGVRNNIGYRFDAKFPTLAKVLRDNGYRTGAAVSSYVLRSETGIDSGFETYDDEIPVAAAGAISEHQRSGRDTLRAASKWLDQNTSTPFFYFFHIYEPHAPYEPTYDADVATADAIVGEFIAKLKALGVYDKAIIVFLSDHGEGLYDHGEDQHGILLYREALQVPLFLKLPNGARKGEAIARPVELTAVYPTIEHLIGLETSSPTLFDDRPHPIYAETLYPRIHLGWSELRALIDVKHHYIEGPRPELYDVTADPAEKHDLIASDRRTASSMREQLAKFNSAIAPIRKIDPEEAKKLAALGYVGSA